MAWLTAGTVTVASGSQSLTGSGTTFTSARVGSEIRLGGVTGDWYEIIGITNNNALTISPAAAGAFTNSAYAIRPVTSSMEGDLVAKIAALLNGFGDALSLTTSSKRLILDKLAAGDSAEVLFEQGGAVQYSIGLTGTNDLTIAHPTHGIVAIVEMSGGVPRTRFVRPVVLPDGTVAAAVLDAGDDTKKAAFRAAIGVGTDSATSYDTKALAQAADIPTTTKVVALQGYSAAGDRVPAPYVSRLSEPAHAGKFFANGVWRELERHDGVYLEDFGAQNSATPTAIDTSKTVGTALADAIDYAFRKQRAIIRVSSGYWILKEKAPPLPVGLRIIGHGHSSSGLHGGSVLYLDYDLVGGAGDFHWNGSGSVGNNTGGGMQGISAVRAHDRHGGALILITGVDDSFRPGYMTFRDLFLGATGTGSVNYCIIQDGSAFVSPGGQGIRDVVWENIWMAGADVETAQFINATHVKINGMQASQGTGAATPAVRITGASSALLHKTVDPQATNISVTGKLILANADHCVVTGAASTLVLDLDNCTNSQILGIWDAVENTSGGTVSASDFSALRAAKNTIIYGHTIDADQTAWTAYTPVVSAGTGTITAASATGAYKVIGKTVFFRLKVGITTNGSGGGNVRASIPPFAPKETMPWRANDANTGAVLSAITFLGLPQVLIYNSVGVYPGADGWSAVVAGEYEMA